MTIDVNTGVRKQKKPCKRAHTFILKAVYYSYYKSAF